MGAIAKFLLALNRLARMRGLKIEDAYKFLQDNDVEEAIGMLVDENIMTYVNKTKKYRIASNFS